MRPTTAVQMLPKKVLHAIKLAKDNKPSGPDGKPVEIDILIETLSYQRTNECMGFIWYIIRELCSTTRD